MTIESRVSMAVQKAGHPPSFAASFRMGVRAYTDWMDLVWTAGQSCLRVDTALGYDVDLDEDSPPDHVLFEVYS